MRCEHGFEPSSGLCPECSPLPAKSAKPRLTLLCKRCGRRVARSKLDADRRCIGGCKELVPWGPK